MDSTANRVLHFLLRSLPTTAIAGTAFIAINHSPASDGYRLCLATAVAILIQLNSTYGPQMGYESKKLMKGFASPQPD
jgi:hypothetical protein